MSGAKTLMLAGALLALLVVGSMFVQSNWEGVDVAVVGNKAEQLGAKPADPLINITGDLLLFVFTAAGVVGGFIAGYTWRGLFGRDAAKAAHDSSKSQHEGNYSDQRPRT